MGVPPMPRRATPMQRRGNVTTERATQSPTNVQTHLNTQGNFQDCGREPHHAEHTESHQRVMSGQDKTGCDEPCSCHKWPNQHRQQLIHQVRFPLCSRDHRQRCTPQKRHQAHLSDEFDENDGGQHGRRVRFIRSFLTGGLPCSYKPPRFVPQEPAARANPPHRHLIGGTLLSCRATKNPPKWVSCGAVVTHVTRWSLLPAWPCRISWATV